MPPPVFHRLITATWQRRGGRPPSRWDRQAYLPPFTFVWYLFFFFFFEHVWRKLCIWQSEILCWVTYSVQFKVPLFLLHSAGIGSHRGAVQPLHCRGSDCRGRQRERERFDICILQPRPHQTDPRVRRRHPSTRSSSTCHHKQKKIKKSKHFLTQTEILLVESAPQREEPRFTHSKDVF